MTSPAVPALEAIDPGLGRVGDLDADAELDKLRHVRERSDGLAVQVQEVKPWREVDVGIQRDQDGHLEANTVLGIRSRMPV